MAKGFGADIAAVIKSRRVFGGAGKRVTTDPIVQMLDLVSNALADLYESRAAAGDAIFL
jgi:hypothetical protein